MEVGDDGDSDVSNPLWFYFPLGVICIILGVWEPFIILLCVGNILHKLSILCHTILLLIFEVVDRCNTCG
jgi:hypothetical protein